MTVKITLEYATVDLAIVALAKLTKADGVAMTPEGPRKERKGRNDKGKPRGPHAAAQQEAAAPAEQERTDKAATLPPEAAPAEAHKALPSGEVPPVAAASTEVVPEADAQQALEKLFALPPEKGGGINGARDVMARFGVKRLRDLPATSRAEFIALAEKVVAGGKV